MQKTAEILLEAACPSEDILTLDPEVAQGILGEEASIYEQAAAAAVNLPPDLADINQELQKAAARLQGRQEHDPTKPYWQPPPADARWTKEAWG